MKANEAVRSVMKGKGIRPADLRRRLGIESNTMANRLMRESMNVNKLAEMLRAMDYKLVAVPADTRLSADEYEVE